MQYLNIKIANKKGFTLVEILLYIGIAAVMATAVSFFMHIIIQSKVENQTAAEVEQQGIQVMQIISQAVRNSSGISLPLPGAGAASLSLASDEPGKNPTVFDLSGGTIRIKEGGLAEIDLTSTRVIASNLTFQNLSWPGTPGIIRVGFTLSHINPGSRQEYQYEKNFYGSAGLR